MGTELQPRPRPWLRAVLLALLLVPLALSTAGWTTKLFALVFWVLLFGSYRVARIRDGRFERRMVVGFYPLRLRRWSLEKFEQLEVDVEQASGPWSVVLMALVVLCCGLSFVLLWVLDWLFPWLGGRTTIWLRTYRGRRILVWQGNSHDAFEKNAALLEIATGLTLQRGGGGRP